MNTLRCIVEWGSYWWHLRLGMLNYTQKCLKDMSSTALLTVSFRQTAVQRSWIKITTSYVSNVHQDWFPGCGIHYITELYLMRLSDHWSSTSSHLIEANRGSCSISNCITKRDIDGENWIGLLLSASFYLYTYN